ncbi:hypothetical protein [Bradyrhizobium sp. Ec3.3]|uniref:hypothetical protein n=1 Tax=Bradyrhizobium sp. Ec3.3 TaxID=189753 RepID=UPI00041AA58A|nr:hypothetical protein [Bradyrhizobium sp. Ec3.3]
MIFTKPKSPTLASRIAALDEEIAAGAATIANLQTRRRAAILDGDDAARTVIEDAIASAEREATLRTERRDILVSEHEAALARDAREEFARRHAVQGEINAKVAASGQKALRKAWEITATALREFADARVATDLLNKAAPEGFSQLAYADDLARGASAQACVVLSDKEVEQWAFLSTGNRVGDQDAVQGGILPVGLHAQPQRCVKRRFRHVRFHPAENARHALPISTELRFPRWDAAGPIFDGALVVPDAVATALNTIEENQRSKTARPVLEEFIAIDDAASDAA